LRDILTKIASYPSFYKRFEGNSPLSKTERLEKKRNDEGKLDVNFETKYALAMNIAIPFQHAAHMQEEL